MEELIPEIEQFYSIFNDFLNKKNYKVIDKYILQNKNNQKICLLILRGLILFQSYSIIFKNKQNNKILLSIVKKHLTEPDYKIDNNLLITFIYKLILLEYEYLSKNNLNNKKELKLRIELDCNLVNLINNFICMDFFISHTIETKKLENQNHLKKLEKLIELENKKPETKVINKISDNKTNDKNEIKFTEKTDKKKDLFINKIKNNKEYREILKLIYITGNTPYGACKEVNPNISDKFYKWHSYNLEKINKYLPEIKKILVEI